jgi:hypothetical protein
MPAQPIWFNRISPKSIGAGFDARPDNIDDLVRLADLAAFGGLFFLEHRLRSS